MHKHQSNLGKYTKHDFFPIDIFKHEVGSNECWHTCLENWWGDVRLTMPIKSMLAKITHSLVKAKKE